MRFRIRQLKFIFCAFTSEGSADRILFPFTFELQFSAVDPLLPGTVSLSLVFQRISLPFIPESEQHYPQKSRQCAFSPAVFLTDGVAAICKIIGKVT